jgi:hypothetical protein
MAKNVITRKKNGNKMAMHLANVRFRLHFGGNTLHFHEFMRLSPLEPLEKLMVAHLPTKFLVSYGTPQFITILFPISTVSHCSRDSGVGTVEHRGFGVRVPVRSRIFSSPSRPDRLGGPPNILSNAYRRWISWGVKLTTSLQLLPRSRTQKMWIYTSTPPHAFMAYCLIS